MMPLMHWLPVAILFGFVISMLAPAIYRAAPRYAAWVLALLPIGLSALFAGLMPTILAGESARIAIPWIPGIDVVLSFYVDGLSLLFALMISLIGALVVIYGGSYLAGHRDLPRFYAAILGFMMAMLGVVLSDNLLTLFIFWELTSFTSYLLIGFDHGKAEARASALQALLITAGGGLALLAGFLLLGMITGSMELSEIIRSGDVIRLHALYLPVLLLVLLGAFTKSAQFPFHFWLPNAMAAPTPVSAYLHSATMVKAGIYLLARFSPVMADTTTWIVIVGTAGGLTMAIGAVMALRQTDLKLVLAYSTVMVLGSLTLLLGLGTTLAVKAAVIFLLAHSLYKGALFLVVGAVDHETGTRDVRKLGGLWRAMPITAAAAVIAGLSAAGLGPVLGFISKELVYEALLDLAVAPRLIAGVAVVANGLLVAVIGLVVLRPFFGRRGEAGVEAHEAPVALWLGPAVMAMTGLIFGAIPGIAAAVAEPAIAAVLGAPIEVELYLYHGLQPALVLSAITLTLGALIFLSWPRLHPALLRVDPVLAWGPARWYEGALAGLIAGAKWQTQVIQSGILRRYILIILLTAIALVGGTLLYYGEGPLRFPDMSGRFYEWAIAALIVVAALTAVRSRSRLASIISLGVVGYLVALIFVLYGAPDLAMTQFLTETLVVIIVALMMIHLPNFRISEQVSVPKRTRDALVAGIFGSLMTILLLMITELPFDAASTEYYAEQSVPGAHGRNIVNVILVDFRALDTLGEIVVLAVAGIGVFALLKLRAVRRQHGAGVDS
jgi:multicomponent Na+:H+ antiporter subunit A